jgi:hypothetical protein
MPSAINLQRETAYFGSWLQKFSQRSSDPIAAHAHHEPGRREEEARVLLFCEGTPMVTQGPHTRPLLLKVLLLQNIATLGTKP